MPRLRPKQINPETASTGDVLTWSGTDWVPATPSGGGGPDPINEKDGETLVVSKPDFKRSRSSAYDDYLGNLWVICEDHLVQVDPFQNKAIANYPVQPGKIWTDGAFSEYNGSVIFLVGIDATSVETTGSLAIMGFGLESTVTTGVPLFFNEIIEGLPHFPPGVSPQVATDETGATDAFFTFDGGGNVYWLDSTGTQINQISFPNPVTSLAYDSNTANYTDSLPRLWVVTTDGTLVTGHRIELGGFTEDGTTDAFGELAASPAPQIAVTGSVIRLVGFQSALFFYQMATVNPESLATSSVDDVINSNGVPYSIASNSVGDQYQVLARYPSSSYNFLLFDGATNTFLYSNSFGDNGGYTQRYLKFWNGFYYAPDPFYPDSLKSSSTLTTVTSTPGTLAFVLKDYGGKVFHADFPLTTRPASTQGDTFPFEDWFGVGNTLYGTAPLLIDSVEVPDDSIVYLRRALSLHEPGLYVKTTVKGLGPDTWVLTYAVNFSALYRPPAGAPAPYRLSPDRILDRCLVFIGAPYNSLWAPTINYLQPAQPGAPMDVPVNGETDAVVDYVITSFDLPGLGSFGYDGDSGTWVALANGKLIIDKNDDIPGIAPGALLLDSTDSFVDADLYIRRFLKVIDAGSGDTPWILGLPLESELSIGNAWGGPSPDPIGFTPSPPYGVSGVRLPYTVFVAGDGAYYQNTVWRVPGYSANQAPVVQVQEVLSDFPDYSVVLTTDPSDAVTIPPSVRGFTNVDNPPSTLYEVTVHLLVVGAGGTGTGTVSIFHTDAQGLVNDTTDAVDLTTGGRTKAIFTVFPDGNNPITYDTSGLTGLDGGQTCTLRIFVRRLLNHTP